MPEWIPSPFWSGEDVFIIGGGSSLEDFNWELIRGRNTIGINRAYRLGDMIDILIFGDMLFWEKERKEVMESFGNLIVTNVPGIRDDRVFTMPRVEGALSPDTISWCGNTGAAAINLACLLGAERIFLLGFDMKVREGRSHWHEGYESYGRKHIKEISAKYKAFIRSFWDVRKRLEQYFPDVEVFNVNNDSELKEFPIMGMGDFEAMLLEEKR